MLDSCGTVPFDTPEHATYVKNALDVDPEVRHKAIMHGAWLQYTRCAADAMSGVLSANAVVLLPFCSIGTVSGASVCADTYFSAAAANGGDTQAGGQRQQPGHVSCYASYTWHALLHRCCCSTLQCSLCSKPSASCAPAKACPTPAAAGAISMPPKPRRKCPRHCSAHSNACGNSTTTPPHHSLQACHTHCHLPPPTATPPPAAESSPPVSCACCGPLWAPSTTCWRWRHALLSALGRQQHSSLPSRCDMDHPAWAIAHSKRRVPRGRAGGGRQQASLAVALCLAPCWVLPACCSLTRQAASKLARCTWHRHWHAGMLVRLGWQHQAAARMRSCILIAMVAWGHVVV